MKELILGDLAGFRPRNETWLSHRCYAWPYRKLIDRIRYNDVLRGISLQVDLDEAGTSLTGHARDMRCTASSASRLVALPLRLDGAGGRTWRPKPPGRAFRASRELGPDGAACGLDIAGVEEYRP
jgi:hypothetical protein